MNREELDRLLFARFSQLKRYDNELSEITVTDRTTGERATFKYGFRGGQDSMAWMLSRVLKGSKICV